MSYTAPHYTVHVFGRRWKMRGDYGTPKGWTGPVTRLDDLSDAERAEVGAPPRVQQPDVGIKRCSSWPCKLWIASDATRCPHCHVKQDG